MTSTPTPTTTDLGDALPKRTTPTWEMEILLSGATVFALFQAYAELNVAVFWLIERLPNDLKGLMSPVGLYIQGGVLGLALGFLAHLMLRAVWVSLVGLRSVDPEAPPAQRESRPGAARPAGGGARRAASSHRLAG